MPFLSYTFDIWTAGKIEFNLILMSFLFMAIVLQNYSIMFTEFFKKTNLAKEILTYNVLKVVVTILSLFIFGYYKLVEGMGGALLIGEILGLIYFFITLKRFFILKRSIRVFLYSLLPVVFFTFSLFYYSLTLKYVYFLFFNVLVLIISLKTQFLKINKNK